MKKGLIEWVIVGVSLVMIILAVAFAAATLFGKEHVEKKYLFEASIIQESDKVETYTRSFLRATDLSSLQAIYDSGTEYVVLPYDFNPSGYPKYSDIYKMAYWQIYHEEDKKMPPSDIMKNKIRQEISWISSCYLKDYRDAFEDFIDNSDFRMDLSESGILQVKDFTNSHINTLGDGMSFSRETLVEDQSIDIERRFNPHSEINTRLGRIIEVAWDIVHNDKLGECVRGNTCTHSTDEELQKELNELSDEFKKNEIDIGFIFDLKKYNSGVINVSIYDTSKNYSLYSFPDEIVRIESLGVNFLVKVGDNIDRSDEIPASSVTDFDDCSGYSDLGIISPKETDDICKFFTVSPTDCQDTDGLDFTTAGTCTDFTGSYDDMCFDLDGNGQDETLYEYDCHSSNICYFTQRYCPSGCVDNACSIGCTQDSDCDDGNPCTDEICHDAGLDTAWCENPDKPDGINCGKNTRTCPDITEPLCECEDATGIWWCQTNTPQECDRTCQSGVCQDCTPSACERVDSGCCNDNYCPISEPNCYSIDHNCYRCVDDADCPQDGFYCEGDTIEQINWYCNPGPGDCIDDIISSENCNERDDDWYCDGDVRKQWDWSCDPSNSPISVECYEESLTNSEDCDLKDGWYCAQGIHHERDYYCSGDPAANCDYYTQSNENTCRFGCKPETNGCWPGIYCLEKTCSNCESQNCMFFVRCDWCDECTITEGCYREDDPQVCYIGKDLVMQCDDWFWCTNCNCWWQSLEACYADCYYMDSCYYK